MNQKLLDKRIQWVDSCRGVALVLVVLGHMGIPIFGKYFTSFHLALFFFLSGVTFHADNHFIRFILKKAKRLLVPYFCLGIPLIASSFITRLIEGGHTVPEYADVLVRFIVQRRMYTIWFLTALFIMSVILYLVVRYVRHIGGIFCVGFLLGTVGMLYTKMVGVNLPWNVDVAFTAFPFISTGYCFGIAYKSKPQKVCRWFRWDAFLAAGVLYLTLVFLNEHLTGQKLDFAMNMYGVPVISLIAAFCGIYCSIFFTMKLPTNEKILRYLGQNTYVYFAWHQSIVLPVLLELYQRIGIFQWEGVINSMGRTLVTVPLIFAALYPFDRWLGKTRFRFCLGK